MPFHSFANIVTTSFMVTWMINILVLCKENVTVWLCLIMLVMEVSDMVIKENML